MPYQKQDKATKGENFSPSYIAGRRVLGCELPLKAPYLILIDASELCNFKCSYCFRGTGTGSPSSYAMNNKLMNWDTFSKAVDQILNFTTSIKKISLSGHGEPLINRKLPQMVKYIKEKGLTCPIEIHTNGSLLDEKFANELADSGIDRIILSIQGVNSEKYLENANIKIDFERFIHNLGHLYKRKQNTMIYAKIVDTCLSLGEESTFIEIFSTVADKIFIEKDLPLWKGQESPPSMQINKFNKIIPYQDCCSLAFYSLLISPNGDIYPCTQPEISFSLGNVYNHSLLDCWNSPQRKDFLIKHLKAGRKSLSDCVDCYISQNSIMTEEDMIDHYRDDILRRMEKN